MTDKINEIADELFKVWTERKELEVKEKTLKEAIQTYLEKTSLDKFTSEEYILSLESKITYDVPTPDQLIELMGETFAYNYITEVVDKKVREDLPPHLQSQLCPVKTQTNFVAVRKRRELQDDDYARYKAKEKV